MFDLGMVQGILSLIIAIAAFYFARKKDTHDTASQSMEVIVELRTVRRDISELKTDVQAMRTEWREDHDKIVSMERDIKAMWRHIDKMNGVKRDEQ